MIPQCRSDGPHVLGDFWKLMLLTSSQNTEVTVEGISFWKESAFFIDSGSLLLYEYKIDDAEGQVLAKRPSKCCNKHTVHIFSKCLVYNKKIANCVLRMYVLQVDKSGYWLKYRILHSNLERQYKMLLARMLVASENIYFLLCTYAFACDNEVQGESCFLENMMTDIGSERGRWRST